MIKFFCITKINQFINHLQSKDIKHREREIREGGKVTCNEGGGEEECKEERKKKEKTEE